MKRQILLYALILLFTHAFCANKNTFLLRTSNNKQEISLSINRLEKKYPSTQNRLSKLQPQKIKLKTPKKLKFDANFYDHGKDQIIILGHWFGGDKHAMDKFVKAFGASYDMISFDYRWKDFKTHCLDPRTFISPFGNFIDAELDEVHTVLDFVKKRKKYKDVICLAVCYSGFLFLMAQAKAEEKGGSLFSKMIIDSCWYSLDGMLKQVSNDPMLFQNPGKGGTPRLVKGLLKGSVVYNLGYQAIKKCLPNVCISNYVRKISAPPIFFIHAADDKLVPLNYFDQMWLASPAQKVGLITPYRHADNFKNEALYTFLCDQFIQTPSIDDFIKLCCV